MQRLILRSSSGIPSTLHSLSILRHFEERFGPSAFTNFRAPRDSVTHRHHGYIIVEASDATVDRIFDAGPTYTVKVKGPAVEAGSVKGKEPAIPQSDYRRDNRPVRSGKRHNVRLAEVAELLQGGGQSSSQEPHDQIEITVEQASNDNLFTQPSSSYSRFSFSASQSPEESLFPNARPPKIPQSQLDDMFTLFDGFAKPGRLKVHRESQTSQSVLASLRREKEQWKSRSRLSSLEGDSNDPIDTPRRSPMSASQRAAQQTEEMLDDHRRRSKESAAFGKATPSGGPARQASLTSAFRGNYAADVKDLQTGRSGVLPAASKAADELEAIIPTDRAAEDAASSVRSPKDAGFV